MKMHKKNKRSPKGPWIMLKFLKANTNRMKNKEWMKNDVEIDCDHDSVAI